MTIYFDLKKPLENIANQILNEIEQLKEEEKRYSDCYSKIYKMDDKKPGNKKFVARQLETKKLWRQKIKGLFREYLKLKFSEDELKVMVDTHSNHQIKENIFRFKIKIDNTAKWYELSQDTYSSRYSILGFEENDKRKLIRLPNHESLLFQKNILSRIFNGSQLENISFSEAKKKTDSFWSNWKTSMGAFNNEIVHLPKFLQNGILYFFEPLFRENPSWIEYQRIIHPALKKVALEILKSCSTPCSKVVEICGGGGELAREIAQHYPRQLNYYLLEYNERSLQVARGRISNIFMNEEIKRNIIPIKTDVTDSNDYFIDAEKQHPMETSSIDLIIGSGALTVCVLENKEVALEVAKKCYGLLKPGGKMILAGHTHSFLNSQDFIKLGFNVINSFFVGVENGPFFTKVNEWEHLLSEGINKEFYVLEK